MSTSGRKWVRLGALLTAVFGLCFAAFALGPQPLELFNTDWIYGDFAQVYLAWAQYGAVKAIHWLDLSRMSYPLPISFALFDPMPILLIVLSPFFGFLPAGTQYFGVYFTVSLAAQGVFGYLAVGELLKSVPEEEMPWKLLVRLAGGFLFVLAPFTIHRFLNHTALSSQWVLALSIWMSLRTIRADTGKWLAMNGGVMFLATGINPYIALMVGINSSLFTLVQAGARHLFPSFLRGLSLAVIGLIGLAFFGYLAGGGAADGYGHYSMNMLGPIDSNGAATLFGLDVLDATGGQAWEGFNYLGLGGILLVVLAVVLLIRPGAKTSFSLAAAFSIVAASYVLALSSTVTFASESLVIEIPQLVASLFERFRASGRLFWIGALWLTIIGIAVVAARLGLRRGALVLMVLVAIQLVDVAGYASAVRQDIAGFQRLTVPAQLTAIAEESPHKAVIVLPPWECAFGDSPAGSRNFELFGFLAVQQNMATNNFYAARTPDYQHNYHCNDQKILAALDAENIYVLSDEFYRKHGMWFSELFSCTSIEEFEDVKVCFVPMP